MKTKPKKKESKCSKSDDMFARTNEGYGYFQCQKHLRDSVLCNRETKSKPKKLVACGWGLKNKDGELLSFVLPEKNHRLFNGYIELKDKKVRVKITEI